MANCLGTLCCSIPHPPVRCMPSSTRGEMVLKDVSIEKCIRQEMLDALIFSLAAYEPTPEKVLAVLRYKYDLPVGTLDLLPIEGISIGSPGLQPILVGRSTTGNIIVACRGTADLADLVVDLKYLPRRLRFAEGAAHFGFVERAQSIDVAPFLKLILTGEKLVFTGHSLGGAVASLLALRVLEASALQGLCPHRRQVECITFGAPLFADAGLAELINARYRHLFCHVISKGDFVPKILPLVAVAERVFWGGPNDQLEVLRLARMGLELFEGMTKFPIATALRVLEHSIPGPLRSAAGFALRLLWPENPMDRYAFAGDVLLLDLGAPEVRHAAQLTKAEEMNWWTSQLGFALGLHPAGLAEHGLMSYYKGIARALSSRFRTHVSKGDVDTKALAADATEAGLQLGGVVAQQMLAEEEDGGGNCKVTINCSVEVLERVHSFKRARLTEEPTLMRQVSLNGQLLKRQQSTVTCCSGCQKAVQLHTTCEVVVEKEGKPARRRIFRFRWLLGTIGKVSRHLRSFDKACVMFSLVKLLLRSPFF